MSFVVHFLFLALLMLYALAMLSWSLWHSYHAFNKKTDKKRADYHYKKACDIKTAFPCFYRDVLEFLKNLLKKFKRKEDVDIFDEVRSSKRAEKNNDSPPTKKIPITAEKESVKTDSDSNKAPLHHEMRMEEVALEQEHASACLKMSTYRKKSADNMLIAASTEKVVFSDYLANPENHKNALQYYKKILEIENKKTEIREAIEESAACEQRAFKQFAENESFWKPLVIEAMLHGKSRVKEIEDRFNNEPELLALELKSKFEKEPTNGKTFHMNKIAENQKETPAPVFIMEVVK